MSLFTRQQKAKCAAREAAMRHNVYRGKVKAGTMSSAEAASEEAMMREIAADYAAPPPVTAQDVVDYYRRRGGGPLLIDLPGAKMPDDIEVAILDIRASRGEIPRR